MRLLIATGIYPPEIGGPAFYAKNLEDALRAKGHMVEIGTFGSLKKLPTGLRHFALFLRLLPMARHADAIVALDTFSAALPAFFAAKLFGKKLIVRTGGDFVWEQYIERTKDPLPLPVFYAKHQPFTLKERLYFALTKFLLARSVIVFSTDFQKDIWLSAYGLDAAKVRVIPNAISGSFEPLPPTGKNFLWYSRDIALKNGPNLRRAFEIASRRAPGITIETGQVPQKELIEKIRSAYAVILPSISEISPNYILDALRCGKPFIATKYTEYAKTYADLGLFVDPLDPEDIAEKIVLLANDAKHADLSMRIKAQPLTRTYAELADDFLALIKTV